MKNEGNIRAHIVSNAGNVKSSAGRTLNKFKEMSLQVNGFKSQKKTKEVGRKRSNSVPMNVN